jgi:hypothetical protein
MFPEMQSLSTLHPVAYIHNFKADVVGCCETMTSLGRAEMLGAGVGIFKFKSIVLDGF